MRVTFPLAMILSLLFLSSLTFAWPAFVADTWNTNQVYAGSFYQPTTPYSGWVYNAYYPSNGYPVMGGGRYFPPGYYAGSYAVYPPYDYGYGYAYPSYNADPGHYVSGSYYGAPIHSGIDFTYSRGNTYVRCTIYGC